VEIRRSLKPVPSRAIALVIAALAVLALMLTAGYTLGPRPHSGPPTVGTAAPGEQINHNRSEEGLGGATSVGGQQVSHNRSEEGLTNN
jgi:hypothetical protein